MRSDCTIWEHSTRPILICEASHKLFTPWMQTECHLQLGWQYTDCRILPPRRVEIPPPREQWAPAWDATGPWDHASRQIKSHYSCWTHDIATHYIQHSASQLCVLPTWLCLCSDRENTAHIISWCLPFQLAMQFQELLEPNRKGMNVLHTIAVCVHMWEGDSE